MAKALRRSSTGAGYQDIKSPEPLETDLLTVGTTMVAPSGISFPGSPTDGEWFWRTDTGVLYRYNAGGPAWEPIVAGSIYGARSGVVPKVDFTGSPKTATVVFATAEPDTDYVVNHVVHVTGSSNAAFIATVEGKTVNGFDICMHTGNVNDLVAVDWTVHRAGT